MKSNKFQIDPETITWDCPVNPAWEYTEIWHQLQKAKKDLGDILNLMQKIDKPNDNDDRQMRLLIRSVQSRLEYTVHIVS